MAENKERVIKGIAASPGIAIGTALLYGDSVTNFKIHEQRIDPEDVSSELARFQKAIDQTRHQILHLRKHVESTLQENEASIFDAHLLIVDDQMLMKEVEETIKKSHAASSAFQSVIQRYISAMSAMPDPYIRERASDIKDVASRILANLTGTKKRSLADITGQRIIISDDLSPSDTAESDTENLQAFVVQSGSRTSHTAILARSMKIPAVVGLHNLLQIVKDNDLVIVDGFLGTLIINPSKETQKHYAIKEAKKEKYYADLLKESTLRPETIDGFCIQLAANIEQAQDANEARRFGAAGVGLFRTEYLFLNANKLPSEEKQFETYRKTASDLNGQPIIIRTLDVGGDKLSNLLSPLNEPNPFLGLRAVRLCLKHPKLLKTQVRAILRASAYGNIRMMFPMISCHDELDKLLEIVEEIKQELLRNKEPFNEKIEVGIMIETPAAALIADSLAKKVDFFSIGTNDLVQYTIAVDRSNEQVAYLYQPAHPAILTLIKNVVDAARKNHIWVSVCGEMASDPRYTPILVGMGVHELSMGPVSLGIIRRIIRRIKMYEAEKIAERALQCTTAKEALLVAETFLQANVPDVIEITKNGI